MVLQRELNKLGVTLADNRSIFPSTELPKIAEQLGIKFYAPGESYLLPEGEPVVAVIHEDGDNIDLVQYGEIQEFSNQNIVGLFSKG
jgi:hypothetical protein